MSKSDEKKPLNNNLNISNIKKYVKPQLTTKIDSQRRKGLNVFSDDKISAYLPSKQALLKNRFLSSNHRKFIFYIVFIHK